MCTINMYALKYTTGSIFRILLNGISLKKTIKSCVYVGGCCPSCFVFGYILCMTFGFSVSIPQTTLLHRIEFLYNFPSDSFFRSISVSNVFLHSKKYANIFALHYRGSVKYHVNISVFYPDVFFLYFLFYIMYRYV